MKALKYIFFLLLIFIIGFAIYIVVQPNEYSFSRTQVIKAPPSLVFNKVNDFKKWPSFSPWIDQEPNATINYGDKTLGVDGSYAWKGEIIGIGNMKTVAVNTNKSISQKIEFIESFTLKSDIDWIFEEVKDGTKVTWEMKGKQDFVTKMVTTFTGSIEKRTGPSFERGLFKLDSIITTDMQKYSIHVKGITEHGGGFYLYNTTSCKINDLESKLKIMMPKLHNYVSNNNIVMAGAPFIYYHKWDEANNSAMFSCCIPTSEKVISSENDILTGQLPPFKAVKTVLKGDYKNSKEAWKKTMKYITDTTDLEIAENEPMLEVYPNSPINTPNPADLITEIFVAVK